MADLERSGSRMPRRSREKRAYNLVLASGALGTVAVVGFVVALFTDFGMGLPFLAGVLAVICAFLFRRTVS